jgi:hypothetical protein
VAGDRKGGTGLEFMVLSSGANGEGARLAKTRST